jgi:short-subunit dehydrogenase
MGRDLLRGQTAIVTGAAHGLGRVISLEYAAEGATVALLDLDPDKLAETTAEIEAAGGRALPYELDLTDHAAYARVVESVVRTTGRIHVLVNNAAIARYGTVLTDTLDDWRAQIAVNLEAVYVGCKLVAPHMVEARYGRIVNIASIQGFTSSGDAGAYNAAKGGMIAYTKSLAVELGRYEILANAIAPGFMRTRMSFIDGVDETTTPDFQEWYVKRRKVPMGRTGIPEDMAGTAVFLASDYCRYLTGQVIVVDGGLTSTF